MLWLALSSPFFSLLLYSPAGALSPGLGMELGWRQSHQALCSSRVAAAP